MTLPPRQLPRTTIVSANPLRRDMSSGIIMRSLFQDWPRDRLQQVYFHLLANRLPEFDVCDNFHAIGLNGRVRHIRNIPGKVAATEIERGAGEARRRHLVQSLKSRKYLMRWLRLAQELWYGHSWIQRSLREQLIQTQPDVVYGLIGHYGLTKILKDTCRELGLPLYIHVTDDFVTSLYREIPFSRKIQQASTRAFQDAVNYSSGRAAISPLMAHEYHSRYGEDWDWFTTLVDEPLPESQDAGSSERLVYTGNLGLNRWRVLRDLGLALQQINTRQGTSYSLEVYSAEEQLKVLGPKLEVSGVTQLRGWLPQEALPKLYREAALLVHVESDDPESRVYTKFSFSTKLSQYMMAGRCILAIGPPDVASMKIVEQAASGITLPEIIAPENVLHLERILTDASHRRTLAERGRQWAMQWAEGEKRRQDFRASLTLAARGNSVVPSAHQAASHAA